MISFSTSVIKSRIDPPQLSSDEICSFLHDLSVLIVHDSTETSEEEVKMLSQTSVKLVTIADLKSAQKVRVEA